MRASPDEATRATLETIQRFNEAFNRHDVDAVMALMTPDCVFENSVPRRTASASKEPPRCDVFRVRDGKVAEKLAYVKG